MDVRLIRQPSAYAPVAMSLVALALITGYVALFGATRQAEQADEGAPARIFQLLMAAQVPIAAYFVVRWLPREPRQALAVLVLQVCAALVPIVTILVLEQAS